MRLFSPFCIVLALHCPFAWAQAYLSFPSGLAGTPVQSSVFDTRVDQSSPAYIGFMREPAENYKNWYETLPDLNATANTFVNSEEAREGQYLLRVLRGSLPVLEDAWIQNQVEAMVNSLSQKAAMPPIRSLAVIRDPQINAFAAPGGVMGINAGLFLQMHSPDQVAAVIAHELSHLKQRHFQRRQEDLKNLQWITIAAMLAGLALTQANGNLGGAVLTGSQAYNASKTLSYSRQAEKEADRMGMQILRSAGYSPSAMAQTFEIMDRNAASVSYLSFLLTHPLTQERITEARLVEQNLPPLSVRKPLDQDGFRIIQDRLRVLAGEVDETSLSRQNINDPFIGLQMGEVMLKGGRLAEAEGHLKRVVQQQPDWDLPKVLLAEVYLAQKRLPEAGQIIQALYRLTPENTLYRQLLAKYHLANHAPAQAIPILEKLTDENPSSVANWQLLSRAYGSLTRDSMAPARTSYAHAEEMYWSGQTRPARIQLQSAIRLAGQNEILKTKYETRLQQIDDLDKRFAKKYS